MEADFKVKNNMLVRKEKKSEHVLSQFCLPLNRHMP